MDSHVNRMWPSCWPTQGDQPSCQSHLTVTDGLETCGWKRSYSNKPDLKSTEHGCKMTHVGQCPCGIASAWKWRRDPLEKGSVLSDFLPGGQYPCLWEAVRTGGSWWGIDERDWGIDEGERRGKRQRDTRDLFVVLQWGQTVSAPLIASPCQTIFKRNLLMQRGPAYFSFHLF